MVQSQYDQSEILTYKLSEGDWVITGEQIVPPNGESIITGAFTAQVNKENFLEPAATLENGLKLADAIATHFNPYKPEVDTAIPMESTVGGEYNPRIVGAVKLKPGEWFLPVSTVHGEISVNAPLIVDVGGAGLIVDTLNSAHTAIALENVPANTGGYIRCLLNGARLSVAVAQGP